MKGKGTKVSGRSKPATPVSGRPKKKISIDHAVKLVSYFDARRVATPPFRVDHFQNMSAKSHISPALYSYLLVGTFPNLL
jgi:hypothetical protein